MNTIVVPTDFSAAAQNATAYAAQLAKQLGASVLLLHVYQMPVPMTDYPVLIVTNEELKKGADEGLQRVLQEARATHTGVTFSGESRLGNIAAEVDDVCKNYPVIALVIGAKDLGGFERFLFGDTTAAIIKHASCPVIAVPEGTTNALPSNLVLATDLQKLEEVPTAKIAAIVSQLGAVLHVVHVETEGEQTASPDTLMQKLQGINATYHTVIEEDVAEGLKQFVERNNIDLVLILPHRHNFYERLFFKGHTQGILQAMQVPVMCLR